jgi:hypothetical protein
MEAGSDERERPPFAVVTRLELLRRINPESVDELLAKLHGVAFYDLKKRP